MISWFTWSSPGLFENVTVLPTTLLSLILSVLLLTVGQWSTVMALYILGRSLVQNACIVTV